MSNAEFNAFLDTEDAKFILGRPCFMFIKHAQLWRATGEPIPTKAEDEQAYFIGLLLRLAFNNRVTWREDWAEQVRVRQANLAAQAQGQQNEGAES